MRDVKIVAVGESAARVVLGSDTSGLSGARVSAACAALGGLASSLSGEVVPAYCTLLLTYDPRLAGFEEVRDRAARALAAAPDPGAPVRGDAAPQSRLVSIPVCYGGEHGPDLESVAAGAGMTEAEAVRLHCGRDYPVAMLGFMPGFPYLRGLDPRLATPRLDQPRTRIPAGSVGIGGSQTGVYPLEGPGGWSLVGRTPLTLFDPSLPEPVPYRAGDRLRFVPVGAEEFERLAALERAGARALWEGCAALGEGTSHPASAPAAGSPAADTPDVPAHAAGSPCVPALTVLAPGALTTVQDLGRPGHAAVGVARGGAVDRVSPQVANALVGNAPGAACLEFCMLGPTLRFERACTAALTGGCFSPRINGEPVVTGALLRLAPGDVLDWGPARLGTYGYLAVAGGLDVPPVLGSRSTSPAYRLGGAGGGPLRAGDSLSCERATSSSVGTPHVSSPEETPVAPGPLSTLGPLSAPARLSPAPDGPGSRIDVAVVPDPQEAMADPRGVAAFYAGEYRVGTMRDRMGMRLEGPRAGLRRGSPDIVSEGIAPGTVQLPPSGQPIVMLADHQTVGGYPKLGCVSAADLWRLAQAAPGTRVCFRRVGPDRARETLSALQEALGEFRARAGSLSVCAHRDEAGAPPGSSASGRVGGLLAHDPSAGEKLELVRSVARQARARGLGRLGYDWGPGAVSVGRGG